MLGANLSNNNKREVIVDTFSETPLSISLQ